MVWVIYYFRRKRVKYNQEKIVYTDETGTVLEVQPSNSTSKKGVAPKSDVNQTTGNRSIHTTEGFMDETPDISEDPIYDPQEILPWKGRYWKPGCSAFYYGTDMKPRHVVIMNVCFILKRILLAFTIVMYPYFTGMIQTYILVSIQAFFMFPHVMIWRYQSCLF
jgi:hypothetical protein